VLFSVLLVLLEYPRRLLLPGLTRRIDCIVPFFKFTDEEAHVVADMYLDNVRNQYCQPATKGVSDNLFLFLV